MFVTESELREQVRRPTQGARVRVPAGARLSPAAADFVAQWQLVLDEFAPGAGRSGPNGLGPTVRPERTAREGGPADWDVPSRFPVRLDGPAPKCSHCGNQVQRKGHAQTQLNAHYFASKTHPRIRLRGKIDSLHARMLLTQAQAAAAREIELAANLGTLAAYCRELLAAEYDEREPGALSLDGCDEDAIHAVTHDPRGTLGIDHLTLDGSAPEVQHHLNLLRTQSRELEIDALEALGESEEGYGAAICHALNRLSSALYYLQLRLAAKGG